MDTPHAVQPVAVSLRSVIAIALPMTFAHLATPLIGLTDVAVIGQTGSAALIGAVALGALLFAFMGSSLNFLRMGTTALVAQALGARDPAAEQAALLRALVFAAALGAIILALQDPIATLFLFAMDPSEAVASATRRYWTVRVWAVPFMLLNYAMVGWLLGLGRAGTALLLQLLLSLVNILGSVALGLWLDLGLFGIALASVLAEVVLFIAGMSIVVARLRRGARPSLGAVFERAGFLKNLSVNGDIMVRSLILMCVFSTFSAVGARFGDLTLAANALLMNLFLLTAHVLDGLAAAAEQLGGKAVGARGPLAFRRTVRLTLVVGVFVGLAIGALWFHAGPIVLGFLTTAEDVRAEAMQFLIWSALIPLPGALAFVMDGIFIGATWTRALRNMMVASTLAILVAWAVLIPAFGNHGLWAGLALWLALRGATLAALLPSEIGRTFPTAR
ncbi:MAG: MATE family efflux transporter [Pseudomonadota bacterium]